MKTLRKKLSALALAVLCVHSALIAQTTIPAATDATTAVAAKTPENKLLAATSLALKWNEKSRTLKVPFKNTAAAVMVIQGVQTSGGLFVVNFPKSLAAGRTDEIEVLVDTPTGTSAVADYLRLRTNLGDQVIPLNHDREQVFTLDKNNLQWVQDELVLAKSVSFTLAANTAVPKSVKVLSGGGHQAQLESLGGGRYRVAITPASTAKTSQFPVVIEMEPALPGVAPVIHCAVLAKP